MLRKLLTVLFALMLLPLAARAQHHANPKQQGQMSIPASVQAEHKEIHEQLSAATRLAGETGIAARHLAEILQPHFEREEQIALPPLGLLAPLARGEYQPAMLHALPMADSLRNELPQMLNEHKTIAAATQALARAAQKEHKVAGATLAHQLLAHAKTEEEIYYPAAILVGDVIRNRSTAPRGTR